MPMRYRQRLEKVRDWARKKLCTGRQMKTPGKNDYDIVWAEPRCFLCTYPTAVKEDLINVAPGLLLLAGGGYGASDTSEYLDNRSGIDRSKDMGATLSMQFVHVIYDPGERTGIRKEDGRADPKQALIIDENADNGALTVIDWMDDTMAALIGAKSIPGTDLIVNEKTVRFNPLTENGAIADRRPFYLGIVTVDFNSVTRGDNNNEIEAILGNDPDGYGLTDDYATRVSVQL